MTLRRMVVLVLASASPLAVGSCASDPGEPAEQRSDDIIKGTTFTDTIGYVSLSTSGSPSGFGASCSGTFLSPQWILTAGHCFRDASTHLAATTATIAFGSSRLTSSDVYLHPNWWNPSVTFTTQASATAWNAAFDLALIRLTAPVVPTAQFPGNLYSQLTNRFPTVGEQVVCTGYGNSTVPDGNSGVLRQASLGVTAIQPTHNFSFYSANYSLIDVAPNSSGQLIYTGDSGGSCYLQSPFTDPYVISGINDAVNYGGTNMTVMPVGGYLDYPGYSTPWVDQTMYGAISSGTTNLDKAPHLGKYTSTAIVTPHTGPDTVTNSNNDFVVVAYPTGPSNPALTLAPTVTNQPDSWLAFTPLGTGGLPKAVNGSSVTSAVGLAAWNNNGSAQLFLAAIGTDSKMYVGNFIPYAVPSLGLQNFLTLSWSSAGAPTVGFSNATPAIAIAVAGRSDYFGLGKDGQIWTRWMVNNVWQSSWMQIANSVALQSGPSVTVAFGDYFLAAVGTDGYAYTTWLGSAPTTAAYGGPWMSWDSFGMPDPGGASGIAAAGWNRGLDLFSIGSDGNLYHMSMDNDFYWTDWYLLEGGGFYSQGFPNGPTAAGRSASTHQVDVVTTIAGIAPTIFRYPR